MDSSTIAVIGGGPAGLTAAYQLTKADREVTVFEADDVVGGISRTAERDGWRFDIGGHRFFTKVAAVERLWHEILPDGGLPAPPADEPDLLQRRPVRLPAEGRQRPARPRCRRGGPMCRLLSGRADPAAPGPVEL